ncbi:hypothetical protein ACHBTE_23355 [Streptomyces sp. M41]|uniref:hypothetical protein n=1 Tax=Streptomyces sp. M41 TaxID=3059412 RepID=UPI00374CC343
MKLRVKALSSSVIAGAAAVVFAASPASAGTDVYVNTSDPWNAAAAGFAANDELFTVCDNRGDGMRASGHIGWLSPQMSYWVPLQDANGAHNSCARKNLDIAEGTTVTVQICIRNGANGEDRYCETKRGKA